MSENITDELSMSENISSLEQTSLHSGNVSPIPFDHDVSQVCTYMNLSVLVL